MIGDGNHDDVGIYKVYENKTLYCIHKMNSHFFTLKLSDAIEKIKKDSEDNKVNILFVFNREKA